MGPSFEAPGLHHAAWRCGSVAARGTGATGVSMPRIGAMMLLAENDPEQKAWTEAFLQGLQEAG